MLEEIKGSRGRGEELKEIKEEIRVDLMEQRRVWSEELERLRRELNERREMQE